MCGETNYHIVDSMKYPHEISPWNILVHVVYSHPIQQIETPGESTWPMAWSKSLTVKPVSGGFHRACPTMDVTWCYISPISYNLDRSFLLSPANPKFLDVLNLLLDGCEHAALIRLRAQVAEASAEPLPWSSALGKWCWFLQVFLGKMIYIWWAVHIYVTII